MAHRLSAWKKSKMQLSRDESGFTLVEMVIAIPVVFLILGLVLASAGVTVGLMSQVTKGAGAAHAAVAVVDKLNAARNCAEVEQIIAGQKNQSESPYKVTFKDHSCVDGSPLTLDFNVDERDSSKTYYSKSITLAAM